MKRPGKRTLLFVALLLIVSVLLSGCYVEPDIIQSGNESAQGNNARYPDYETFPPATDRPTPSPLRVTPSPARIVMTAGASGMTAAPQGDPMGIGALIVTPPQSMETPVPVTNTPRPTATPSPTSSVLRFGLKNNNAVKDMQRKLKALGFYS